MLSSTLKLNFWYSKKYAHSLSKNRTYSKKLAQVCLYSWDYTINHNENEDENEK